MAELTRDGFTTIGNVNVHNIKNLRVIDRIVFPVRYSDSYYENVVKRNCFGYFAYYRDMIVGELVYRVELKKGSHDHQMYIMAIAVLPAYQKLGIGTRILKHALNIFKNDAKCNCIRLHVHVSNETAIRFYEKNGFVKEATADGYYQGLDPPDAYVLIFNRDSLNNTSLSD
ncbi:hypothetical protein ACOME3_000493 [Neoechinorhynchus agilis]